ncbi:MAG TPA: M15 family metallopeptidase [Urbifossiella sp.]|nr:M15 family metallopeptidase [Urbifossiella sp.]
MFYASRNLGILDGLNPVARTRFAALLDRLDAAGENVLLTDGGRTAWRQNALYEQGRTRPGAIVTDARGDESFHVWKVAVDLVPVTPDGKLRYDDTAAYERIALIANGLGIQWGFALWGVDRPHFQYTQGLTIADFRAGRRLVEEFGPEPLPLIVSAAVRLRGLVRRLRGTPDPARRDFIQRLIDRISRRS